MTSIQWLTDEARKHLPQLKGRLLQPFYWKEQWEEWTWDLEAVTEPLRQKEPRRWIVRAIPGVFREDVNHYAIGGFFGIFAACQQHIFLVYVADRAYAEEFIDGFGERHLRVEHGERVDRVHLHELTKGLIGYHHPNRPAVEDGPWPLPNVWLIDEESPETKARIVRIPEAGFP